MEEQNLTLIFTEKSHPNDFSTGLRVQALMTYTLVVTIGAPCTLGIASYERRGGDPQKRSLKNRLASFMAIIIMTACLTNGGFLLLRIFVGPLGRFTSLLFLWNRELIGSDIVLSITLILGYQCWSIFDWERVSAHCDDFFATFLISAMLIAGGLFSSVNLIVGLDQDGRYFGISGVPEAILTSTQLTLNIHTIPKAIVVTVNAAFVLSSLYKRWRYNVTHPGQNNQVLPVPDLELSEHSRNDSSLVVHVEENPHLNTMDKNKSVLSVGQIILYMGALGLGALLMVFYVNKPGQHFLENYLRTNFIMVLILGILCPISFYIRDPNLRKYVTRDWLKIE